MAHAVIPATTKADIRRIYSHPPAPDLMAMQNSIYRNSTVYSMSSLLGATKFQIYFINGFLYKNYYCYYGHPFTVSLHTSLIFP
jgi:hypothetical protein